MDRGSIVPTLIPIHTDLVDTQKNGGRECRVVSGGEGNGVSSLGKSQVTEVSGKVERVTKVRQSLGERESEINTGKLFQHRGPEKNGYR